MPLGLNELRAELRQLERRLMIELGVIAIVAVGAVVAAVMLL